MRKGRSQRKTRGSLPPLSTRPRAALSDQGAGPQLVIGLAPGRSEELASVEALADSRGTEGPVTARSEPSIPDLEALAQPTLELVRDAERLELVHEHGLDDQSALDAIVSSQHDAQDAAPSQPVEEAYAQDSQADFDLVESSAAPVVHRAALATPDEMSIPPAGDLAVEPVAEQFFSEGELVSSTQPDEEEWDEIRAKAGRKSLPEVVQRRVRFAKYVRWAVGGAAVVCLAALARTAVTPAATKTSASHAIAAPAVIEATPAAKAATPAVATEPAKPAAPAAAEAAEAKAEAAEAKVEAPTVDLPKAAEPTPEAPKAEAAEPAKAAVATGDKTALQEKNDARRSLERGKTADAIAAGERSVALDPTDGEAWLLLGAAYQEKGLNAEARRAFTSCLKEGKRGPMGECRAMLR